jgi:hypothetical protein
VVGHGCVLSGLNFLREALCMGSIPDFRTMSAPFQLRGPPPAAYLLHVHYNLDEAGSSSRSATKTLCDLLMCQCFYPSRS